MRGCFFAWVITFYFSMSLAAFADSVCQSSMREVPEGSLPLFFDDAGLENVRAAVEKSLKGFSAFTKKDEIEICDRKYSVGSLRASLQTFLKGVANYSNEADFQRFIFENFTICQSQGRDGTGEMLVTGYYEPLFAGSLEKKAPYLHPLYQLPADLVVTAEKKVGRMLGGRLVPYWSRSEIENSDLLAGNELIYLADPVEAFILHVQGSGRIRLPDGRVFAMGFAGSNGRKYRSIGKLLVERGVMSLQEVTMPKIVTYLHDNPQEMQAILHFNERYIFFTLSAASGSSPHEGPVGSLGKPLTAGRSLALDKSCFPVPMIGYLETEVPYFDDSGKPAGWKPLHRFVVNQDSGAAIKGPGRVDLFYGSDGYAEKAAGVMKQPGTMYFLILKK